MVAEPGRTWRRWSSTLKASQAGVTQAGGRLRTTDRAPRVALPMHGTTRLRTDTFLPGRPLPSLLPLRWRFCPAPRTGERTWERRALRQFPERPYLRQIEPG